MNEIADSLKQDPAVPKPTVLDSCVHLVADPRSPDCLVAIYTKDPSLLGKRFVLDHSPVRVGRGSENSIILEGDSISRRHAYFEQRAQAWFCADDGSTNGTFVNDEQLEAPTRLQNGDRIKIGSTILKYLTGHDVESQYHEEIYRMTIIDGLTQAYVKRYLLESLEKEILRSRLHARSLSLLMFDIDFFKRVNDTYGHLAGDEVLKAVARVVRGRVRRNQVFARYSGAEFAVVMPETTQEEAVALAEELRVKVEGMSIEFQGQTIRVTISIGCALLTDADRSIDDLIRRADESLYAARRRGGNRTASGADAERVRRHLDAVVAIDRGRGGTAIAFEIASETKIRTQCGSPAYDAAYARLLEAVDAASHEDDLVGVWRDRVVVVVRPKHVTIPIGDTLSAIKRSFRDAASSDAEVTLGSAVLPPDALDLPSGAMIDRILHELRDVPLPVPLAISGNVHARPTSESRCSALRDAIERGLAYIVAVELAVLRDSDPKGAAGVLRGAIGRDLGTGMWQELADRLSLLVNEVDAVGALARGLRDETGKITEAGRSIQAAVTVRNRVTHGASRDPDSYAEEELDLRHGLRAIHDVVMPIVRWPLVAVASIVEQVDDELTTYELWDLTGLARTYSRRVVTLRSKLRKDWCYLLRGADKPLLLAPFFFAKTCDECKELDVAWVRRVVPGLRGAQVTGKGLMTDHAMTTSLPADAGLEGLAELLG